MKVLIIIAAFTLSSALVNAQSKKAANDTIKSDVSRNATANKSKSKEEVKSNPKKLPKGTAIHGGKVVPVHHGKHDYTPGSPVGTGGAGGSTMSGSPQGSASENAIGNESSDELLEKNKATKKSKTSKSTKSSKKKAE